MHDTSQNIIPKRLTTGGRIKVISPSSSIAVLSKEQCEIANEKLMEQGWTVVTDTLDHPVSDAFDSTPISIRLNDIHEGFLSEETDAILTSIGGLTAIQILDQIDFDVLKKNPKVFCGYSDITVLLNAIYAKTGMETYLGPHFSTFGQKYGDPYTMEYFKKAVCQNEEFSIRPAAKWSNDQWYLDQGNRHFIDNPGWWTINKGKAEGIALGGHIGSFCLLKGTDYFPSLKNSVLFLEECDIESLLNFDRQLEGLMLLPEFKDVQALVIGRFEKNSEVTEQLLSTLLLQKPLLQKMPIIANVDFGHTDPKITIPIGRTVQVDTNIHSGTITFFSPSK